MDVLTRIWEDLISRIGGPMSLRLFLQPAMALFFWHSRRSQGRARGLPRLSLDDFHRSDGSELSSARRVEGDGQSFSSWPSSSMGFISSSSVAGSIRERRSLRL